MYTYNNIGNADRYWTGHVLRHDEFLCNILEEECLGNQQAKEDKYRCSTIWLIRKTMLLIYEERG